uniref:RanBD1 domain-containing protein n=1 Tax=Sinocyclocheilus rhinocerous TaxID=307959 RepID=A0A673KE49_9TELE
IDQYITSQDFGSTATQNGLKEIHNGGPIVSLPEVEVKSGEEDEEILFKERTKLYCWDCENELWKELGVGDIKILFHPVRKTYRVQMQQDQVLKVCPNSSLTHTTCLLYKHKILLFFFSSTTLLSSSMQTSLTHALEYVLY